MSGSPNAPAATRAVIGIAIAAVGFVLHIGSLGWLAHFVLSNLLDWAGAAAFTVMAQALAAAEAAMPLDRDDSIRIGLVLWTYMIACALNSGWSSNFQIFCRQFDGSSIALDVCEHDTICDVKTKIERKIGVPIAFQSLIFSGKLLDDAASLLDYKISKEATLLLTSRLRGAAPKHGQSTSATDPHAEQRAKSEALGLSVHYIQNELPKEVPLHACMHAHTCLPTCAGLCMRTSARACAQALTRKHIQVERAGPIYGHFCTANGGKWCGRDAIDCPAGRGALSAAEARPYDIDAPVLRAKGEDLTCPRDGGKGCAFVDYVAQVSDAAAAVLTCGSTRSIAMVAVER